MPTADKRRDTLQTNFMIVFSENLFNLSFFELNVLTYLWVVLAHH